MVWTFHQVGERAGIHSVHSVVEDAVEQNSWGKSGSDWMCLFINNGGLHRTSGDAPPETHDVGERAGIHSVLTNDSAEAFFYQQMISSWFGCFIELGREQESTPYPPMILSAVLAETLARDIRLQY